MNTLISIIEDKLNIPCIAEEDAVMDGSFNVEPWASSAFSGDGVPLIINDHVAVNLFYTDKADLIDAVHTLWTELAKINIGVANPDYSYQSSGNLWMATINVQI